MFRHNTTAYLWQSGGKRGRDGVTDGWVNGIDNNLYFGFEGRGISEQKYVVDSY